MLMNSFRIFCSFCGSSDGLEPNTLGGFDCNICGLENVDFFRSSNEFDGCFDSCVPGDSDHSEYEDCH